jgi:hypothetical protein
MRHTGNQFADRSQSFGLDEALLGDAQIRYRLLARLMQLRVLNRNRQMLRQIGKGADLDGRERGIL